MWLIYVFVSNMLTLQVYALVMMGILTMTVQRRYQHHHPVLVFLQTDYVLSGQENAKEHQGVEYWQCYN
jgi:hypothetical protein